MAKLRKCPEELRCRAVHMALTTDGDLTGFFAPSSTTGAPLW